MPRLWGFLSRPVTAFCDGVHRPIGHVSKRDTWSGTPDPRRYARRSPTALNERQISHRLTSYTQHELERSDLGAGGEQGGRVFMY